MYVLQPATTHALPRSTTSSCGTSYKWIHKWLSRSLISPRSFFVFHLSMRFTKAIACIIDILCCFSIILCELTDLHWDRLKLGTYICHFVMCWYDPFDFYSWFDRIASSTRWRDDGIHNNNNIVCIESTPYPLLKVGTYSKYVHTLRTWQFPPKPVSCRIDVLLSVEFLMLYVP